MVTVAETGERMEARPITLQELGEMIGVPIVVRAWWGSVREQARRVHTKCGAAVYPYNFSATQFWCSECRLGSIDIKDTKLQLGRGRWLCSGGPSHIQAKYPEIQNGKIILWEGRCRFRYNWGGPKIHDHTQTVEVKAVEYKAMLIVIRRSPTAYSQFLIGVDGNNPYAVMVNRHLNTVKEVLDWLMPKLVREAIARGLNVKRQGDWFFIPTAKEPRRHKNGSHVPQSRPGLTANRLYHGAALVYNCVQTRHRGGLVIYQSVLGANGPAPFVKGNVRAPDHPTLHLKGWHIGVRNRSHPWRNAQRQAGFGD